MWGDFSDKCAYVVLKVSFSDVIYTTINTGSQ